MNEYKNTFTIQIIYVYQSIVNLHLLKKQHNGNYLLLRYTFINVPIYFKVGSNSANSTCRK